ncbi:MAG: hypothetical protein ACYCXW_11220 [Solirubrobacteraceae bacterium]
MRREDSRTVRLAARAAGADESELAQRLTESAVHVAVDPRLPGAVECAEVLIATLQRGLGQISLDPGGLDRRTCERLEAAVCAIRPERPLRFGEPAPHATRIAIGGAPGEICVVPDAHGGRLSRRELPVQQRRPTMLGIVFTASLAAAEAFKDAAAIRDDRCVRHQRLDFCPVALGANLDRAHLPDGGWDPIITLAGVGAIGTAHALILGGLADHGGAVLLDRQPYSQENLGTYSLGGADDVAAATPKVALAEQALPGWRCRPHSGDIAAAIAAVDQGQLPWTPIVLAGLDNHAARRDAQRLQADRLIDAATGDTTVGVRDTRPEGPCLACMLPPAPADSPIEALVALGIPAELARAPSDAVVNDDLIAAAADEAARAVLTAQRGTPICGLLRAAGLTDADPGDYMPSIPFVSQQAACLGVGRLIAIATGVDAELPNFVQYDVLVGPHRAIRQRRAPTPGCGCQQRAEIIDQVRRERRARSSL